MGAKRGAVVAVDATNYLFRAFHALGKRSHAGLPTNALYGLAGSLAKLRDDYPHAALACALDARGKTFRHEIYPAYKGTRKETDPDLIAQIEPAKDVIRALGATLYCVEGVEADDVIATLARTALSTDLDVYIASSDKDLKYLVADGCRIINPSDGSLEDARRVKERYGVPPEAMTDYLTLCGDTADNVPGIPGVGPKTASKWLNEYQDLAGVIANKDAIKGKVGERLRDNLANLELAQRLILLREDVALDPPLEQLRPPEPDAGAVEDLCQRLGFGPQIKARMLGREAAAATIPSVQAEPLRSAAEFKQAGRLLQGCRRLGLAAALTPGDACGKRLARLAVHVEERGFFIDLAEGEDGLAAASDRDAALAFLKQLLADEELELCLAGAKEFLHACANDGIECKSKVHDIEIMEYCRGAGSGAGVARLTRQHLDYQIRDRSEVLGGRGPKTVAQLEPAAALELLCLEAKAARELRSAIGRQLDGATLKLYREVERPVTAALADMERNGVLIDSKGLAKIGAQLAKRMAKLESEVAKHASTEINLNSPAQLATLLYDDLGLDPGRRTRGGARSTNEAELQRLAETSESPVPDLILEHRHVAKLLGTYAEALPKAVNPDTGRLHTRFIQNGAVTGRLASTEPNLQNIPTRTADGQSIRRCFIAAPGHVLLSADYSQIELRILAHFSGDETLLDAFARGDDIHQRTAAELYGVKPDAVEPEQRRFAKTVNFGLIYGMGAFGLAQRAGMPRKEADAMIKRYFARLPKVKAYLEEVKAAAARDKYVATFHGRRIGVDPGGGGHGARAGALRAAINAPMQGTAADIMKLAMTAVRAHLRKGKLRSRMLLQVHDELIFEVPDAEVDALSAALPDLMGGVAELAVALEVNVGTGANWDEAH